MLCCPLLATGNIGGLMAGRGWKDAFVHRWWGHKGGGAVTTPSDLYLQKRCTELGPDHSQPLRPKLNQFYKQVLFLLVAEAWIRQLGRKTVIQARDEMTGRARD